LIIGLLLAGCSTEVQQTPTLNSLPPTKIIVPTSLPATETTIPTNTPISFPLPFAVPSSTPVKYILLDTWREIPIMNGAISGLVIGDQETYLFSTKATIKEISIFYQKEIPRLGWKIQDAPNLKDLTHGHFSFTKEKLTVIFEVFPMQGDVRTVSIYIFKM
jgi:hypothetical protein